MLRYYAGLDVSKDETAICIRDDAGRAGFALKVASDPDEIAEALSVVGDGLRCAVLETGRMTNWLFHELGRRGVPVVCVDARQAHAVLSWSSFRATMYIR